MSNLILFWQLFSPLDLEISKFFIEVLLFINLPFNHYNETLELFPKLASNRVILIPDPLVKIEELRYIDSDFLDYFYKGLSLCCETRSIKLFMPDKSLLDDNFRFSKDEFKKDNWHCNTNYREKLFKKFNYI